MGWEALARWGDDAARIEPLAGGVANDVWSVRVNGVLAVARLGARSDADLAWETELLQHLDREGFTVPVPRAHSVHVSLPRFPGAVGCRGHHAASVVGSVLLS
jgi:Ser/Thr protein kinase RdoA (MazF antagonist)